MWADMAMSGVQSLVKNGIAYSQAKKEAASKKKWQAYNNAMTRLADANNQNTITENEILMNERIADQRFQIGRSAYTTLGEAEANAAATDTEGRSVNMVMFDIERNASQQQARITADANAQYIGIDQQRRSSAFQMATNLDYSYIPKPNAATYALNFAGDMASAYDKYKT